MCFHQTNQARFGSSGDILQYFQDQCRTIAYSIARSCIARGFTHRQAAPRLGPERRVPHAAARFHGSDDDHAGRSVCEYGRRVLRCASRDGARASGPRRHVAAVGGRPRVEANAGAIQVCGGRWRCSAFLSLCVSVHFDSGDRETRVNHRHLAIASHGSSNSFSSRARNTIRKYQSVLSLFRII